MKEDWEKPCGHSFNSDPTADQEVQRVQIYFREVIAFLNDQVYYRHEIMTFSSFFSLAFCAD